MTLLAIDTSSALSSVALVDGEDVVVERTHHDPRRHVEEIGPLLDEVRARVDPATLDAVVCGVGPGPYTGLRVGIAAGLALGAVWDVPVVGVCSLDAVAACAQDRWQSPVGVALDARRREVYWAVYDADGFRVAGPQVGRAADVDDGLRARRWVGSGTLEYLDEFEHHDLSVSTLQPYAQWVGRVAAAALSRGAEIGEVAAPLDAHGTDSGATAAALHGRVLLPPRPLYLRRPDVTIAGGAS